ncbi:restriction endonuclease subunit S, partial [Butyrivibrio sp.]|uniref:restriction endonuclease subunit S n=1 Tax=Butyrivibrio sp. TaxID=28121 RepID=UPI0025B9BA89
MDTKKLRQKILDLAIRGKLVPQDQNDEPASVLLERIREEKKQMVKEGKLKAKDIKNDTIIFKGEDNLHYEKFQDGTVKCIEDEIPFEVPEGWEWTRARNITCKIGAGSTPTGGASVYSGKGIKFIRSQNVYEDGLFLDDIVYISEEINNRMSGSVVFPKDILLNITGGSIGRSSLVPDDFDIGNVNQHVLIVRMVDLDIRQFIHNVIISPYIQNLIIKRQVGSGRGGLSAATFSDFLMPIPSQNEQHRIVKKLSETLSLISAVTDNKEEIAAIIDATKSKVLDLAIRGKLVPQDPNDEPASVLIKRIRAEKEVLIKQGKLNRDKKESIIYKGDDNS